MRLPGPLLKSAYLERPNRFAVWVEVQGRRAYCHMPNPGRMTELLSPGVEMWVRPAPAEHRRTTHDVVLVRGPGGLICLDSRHPPALFLEAREAGLLPELGACSGVRREPARGAGRLDLELTCETGRWLVETKSCTLVEDGLGLFPDAPTVRGARHLDELARAAEEEGVRPAAAFIIQREDARALSPNDATDPRFGEALRAAAAAGVTLFAVRCRVTVEEVTPVERVPVVF